VKQPGAQTLLHNGRIWTGDDGDDGARFTAVEISGNRIVAVGGDELKENAEPGHVAIDLDGRRVIPGLVDSHLHAIRAGLSYSREVDWTEISTLGDALDSIRGAAETRGTGEWVTVLGGWHPTQLDVRRGPTPEELDEAAPGNPVFVHPLYGHDDHAVLNSAAMRAMGWNEGSPDPAGGRLERGPDGASPTGCVSGIPLYTHIMATALTPDPEEEDRSTTAYFARLAQLGLTGVIDAGGLGMTPERYRAVYDVWRRGELPIRVRTLHGAVTPGQELDEIAGWQRYLHPGAGDGLLAVLGIGEAVHYGCHDWEGMDPFCIGDASWNDLVGVASRCAAAGWPMSVHTILDSSVDRVLDALEIVDRSHPLRSLRFSLCHVECISEANIERVARLGLGVTIQGRMAQKSAVAAERWGAEMVRRAPPLGSIRRAGIPIGAGTDGTRSASYNPWLTVWWMVTGRVLDGGPGRDDEHRLSRADALRAYTSGSAWFSFEERERGTLAPGTLADLAVLNHDVFEVPDDAIPATCAELTMVDGRVVHARGAFNNLSIERHRARAAPTRW
jgi:predicted amidohydrolase YtcJ